MSTPNGDPRRLTVTESTPREQQMPGPGERAEPGEIPAAYRRRQQLIGPSAAMQAPQRFSMSIHGTDGTKILTLEEDEDGILQASGDMARVSEAAGSFVREVIAMGGKRLTSAPVPIPSNLGEWLNAQPLGAVLQPVAVNVMNLAWHAALEAGECNCVACLQR